MADIKAVKTKVPSREGVIRSGMTAPYFDLASSIKVADVIYNKGGGACTADQLAAWLDYKSVRSGTYLTRVSAANKHFGLIDTTGNRLIVTERARNILAPVMPDDAIGAKVEAFLSVPLFEKIFEQFKGGQLPPEIGLKNLMTTQYGMVADRAQNAVRVFLNSAEQAGFFSISGDRTRLIQPSTGSNIHPPNKKEEPPPPPAEKPKSGGGGDGPTGGVHSAIIGLLRELPPPGTAWSTPKKQRFLDAFKATIEFIYPEEEQ